MKLKITLFLVIVVLVLSTGCTQQPVQETETTDEQLDKVTISVHPSGHGLPVYVASEFGWFEEAGLDVETLVYISAPSQMEAYNTGAWEIGTTGFGGIILGMAKNDLVLLGTSIDDADLLSFMVRDDSPIYQAGKGNIAEAPEIYGTAEDWEGKEVLIALGTIDEVLLSATLDYLGLTKEDLTTTNMDKTQGFVAFQAGNGDITAANAQYYFTSLDQGWIPVTTGEAANLFMPSVMIASEEIIAERPEVVQKWLNVYMKAVSWIADNQEEAALMFVDFCEENGVTITEENATKFLDIQVIPDKAGQLDLFEKPDGSEYTNLQLALSKLMDYFIQLGSYTEVDKNLMLEESNYDSTFMENLE